MTKYIFEFFILRQMNDSNGMKCLIKKMQTIQML